MDSDLLVRYLGRLESEAAALPVDRRAELVEEVRAHIDTALAEAGRSDEATVRNILERLGPPEDIVAGEVAESHVRDPGASTSAAAGVETFGLKWGAVETIAIVLLGLAWPALFLPFGLILWLGLGIVGLVLAWASGVWSIKQKLLTTVVVVALYASVAAMFFRAPGPDTVDPGPSPIVVPGSPLENSAPE